MSLNHTQMEWVAEHLDHSLDIEKYYNKATSSTIEKAKMSKRLILANLGKLDKCKGKTLDKIDLGLYLILDSLESDGAILV